MDKTELIKLASRGLEKVINRLVFVSEIEKLIPLKDPTDKTIVFRSLLKVQVLPIFEHHLKRRLETEDSDLSGNDLIELLISIVCIGL
jgi:hypothetical protein